MYLHTCNGSSTVPNEKARADNNRNNHSCVLKITTGKSSILLTGDIEAAAEQKLVHDYGEKLAANILVAPHHGSQTSSTIEFIQQVKPKFVLFPTGKDNRYRFPRENIVARYQQIGCQTYNTAEQGAIIFDMTPEQVFLPTLWRQEQLRFWKDI